MNENPEHDASVFEPDERNDALREIDPETPEADVLEQHQPVVDDDREELPSEIPDNAAEADALDQARPVPIDDEWLTE